MSGIKVKDLSQDHGFGSIITGVDYAALEDESVRQEINEVFEERGLIVFDEVEASTEMHLALSTVFGPLKEHPVPSVKRVGTDQAPGVIDMAYDPEKVKDKVGLVEVAGKLLATWIPWHFDHCYNNELNRAGVLRAVTIPPEGGLTGFLDGIELHEAISEETLKQIEDLKVVYTLDLLYENMRFGVPQGFKEFGAAQAALDATAHAKNMPRALHPMVWQRKSGEKVLHVSPWMAVGIHGQENPEGDALLESVCQEMIAKGNPYFHAWKPNQMLIWDNWRMLHGVSGMDPSYQRRMQRTTIKGDYGLGRFEDDAREGGKILEMTV